MMVQFEGSDELVAVPLNQLSRTQEHAHAMREAERQGPEPRLPLPPVEKKKKELTLLDEGGV